MYNIVPVYSDSSKTQTFFFFARSTCSGVVVFTQQIGITGRLWGLYHGCHSLTNQISQLEVGIFHNHLLGGGYENNHLNLLVALFKLQG